MLDEGNSLIHNNKKNMIKNYIDKELNMLSKLYKQNE